VLWLAAFALLVFLEAGGLAHFAALTPAAREVSGLVQFGGRGLERRKRPGKTRWGWRSGGSARRCSCGGAVMLLVSYAACVGLGTVYWRLAYARR